MAVLGRSYRIMYLAQGRRPGLRDVVAAVLRPDDSVVGVYPLREGVGMFRGCYYYDYLSSTDDREGEYFSLVVSPTEDRSDIVRFGLYKASVSEQDRILRPVNITGRIERQTLSGLIEDENEVWGVVKLTDLQGAMTQGLELRGVVSDTETDGRLTLNPKIE